MEAISDQGYSNQSVGTDELGLQKSLHKSSVVQATGSVNYYNYQGGDSSMESVSLELID